MTYDEWLAVEEASYSDMSTSQYLGIIGELDMHDFVDSLTDPKAVSLRKTIAANGNLSFDPDDDFGAANLLYLDELEELHADYAESVVFFKLSAERCCKSVTYPNADKSLLQYNQSQGLYTSKEVDKASSVSISVTGCEERCPATIYGKSSKLDEPQNLGCARWGKDKFFFDSIPNWHLYDSLEIRIPYEDLTIEVV